jgi:hypothetical protein
MTQQGSPDRHAVKEMASRYGWDKILPDLANELADAVDAKGEHVVCPFHGGAGDFRMFKDFAETGGAICSCGVWPDGFSLLMKACGWGFHQVLCEVSAQVGVDSVANVIPAPRERKPVTIDPNEVSKCRRKLNGVWNAGVPLDHPLAEPARLYLANRGLMVPTTKALRFHPSLTYTEKGKVVGRYPGIIAKVTAPDGTPVNLLRTYITSDGFKAPVAEPKKLMEKIPGTTLHGAAIRLFPVREDGRLGTSEGIETGIAATQLTGIPCWPTISTVFMETFEPTPDVMSLAVFADKDRSGAGEQSAQVLVRRSWERGVQSGIFLPDLPIPDGVKGVDWNDELLARLGRSERHARLVAGGMAG